MSCMVNLPKTTFIYLFLSSNKTGSKHYKDIKKLIFILSVRLFEE